MIKLSQKQFKFFEKECRTWLDVYGMMDYHVYIRFDKLETAYANTTGGFSDRQIWITLSTDWDDEWESVPDNKLDDILYKMLEELAHHEATEAFLYRIRCLSNMRYIGERDVDDEIHSLIHKMENAWGKFLKMKKGLKKYEKR